MNVVLFVLFVLYGLACLLYLAFMLQPKPALARGARATLLLALLTHTADIGIRCVDGIHPVASAAEVLSGVAWLLALGFWIVSLRYPIQVVGAFVGPICFALLALARLTPGGAVQGPHGISTLGRVHITLSTAGIAFFALAAALAALYLVAESQLKSKRFGVLFGQGPPLATLDALGHRCVTVGFPLFTVAIVTGALWVARLPHVGIPVRPEYSFSVLAWLAFGGLLVARGTAGWRGRRAAWLTLAGFGGTLAALLIYLARYAVGG